MKILVTGASGLVGRRLVAALRERGDEVVATGRRAAGLPEGVERVEWDPNAGPLPVEALAGVDGVVHLAGETVQGRWTKGKKRRIRESREIGTRNLVEALREASPGIFVSASAIGYYGDRKHVVMNEHSEPGSGFLPDVCKAWEAEAAKAREAGIRTAIVRVGVVLAREGGAYPKMTRPFRMFVGGRIDTGKAWLSWIHVDDLVGVFLHCLDDQRADGVYNGVAPHAVSNAEFTRTVASVLRRPACFPVPSFVLRIVLGEFAQVVTGSTRVMPVRTLGLGYEYRYPRLREAIESLE